MAQLEPIIAKAVEAGGKLRVRSALNPILWPCAIISAPAIFAAVLVDQTPTWLITLIFIPVLVAMFGFLYLLFFDRDKLQSEEFQIQKRSLELIEQKGDDAPLIIDHESLRVIPKPDMTSDQTNGNAS